jgi:hypothetical protein
MVKPVDHMMNEIASDGRAVLFVSDIMICRIEQILATSPPEPLTTLPATGQSRADSGTASAGS